MDEKYKTTGYMDGPLKCQLMELTNDKIVTNNIESEFMHEASI